MQAVNLLPEYAQPGRRWTATGADLSARRILPLGGIAAVVAAVAFGGLYFSRSATSEMFLCHRNHSTCLGLHREAPWTSFTAFHAEETNH